MVKNIDCYTSFSKTNKYIYHFYALSIVNNLNFDINNLNIKINNDNF